MLITIEGIDGTGKTTLIRTLSEKLKDLKPVFTREPTDTWIGAQVRRGIAEEIDPIAEALLFTADHAAHIRDIIRPALLEGKLVISDRYSDSR
ncbi:MAG: dTMP kinase, partial [Methanomicrobiales archaeon]|nr:dTMP kinase [Methanomicrobiales archaeon]